MWSPNSNRSLWAGSKRYKPGRLRAVPTERNSPIMTQIGCQMVVATCDRRYLDRIDACLHSAAEPQPKEITPSLPSPLEGEGEGGGGFFIKFKEFER